MHDDELDHVEGDIDPKKLPPLDDELEVDPEIEEEEETDEEEDEEDEEDGY